MTPMRAIRLKCLDCCCESSTEVKLCPDQDCPLWGYRSGHNPARAGIGRKDFIVKQPILSACSEAWEGDYGEGK